MSKAELKIEQELKQAWQEVQQAKGCQAFCEARDKALRLYRALKAQQRFEQANH